MLPSDAKRSRREGWLSGGGNFFGGQRQRLAIARALVSNAPISVFDEPKGAFGPHHEEWMLDTLRILRQERTIILVTHKVASVADCDQIVVLQGGRIAERGTHAELLKHRGDYAEMNQTGRLAVRGTGDLKLQLAG